MIVMGCQSRELIREGSNSQRDLHNGLHTHMHYTEILYRRYFIYYNTTNYVQIPLSIRSVNLSQIPSLSPPLCVLVDKTRAPGACMYIVIYIRR